MRWIRIAIADDAELFVVQRLDIDRMAFGHYASGSPLPNAKHLIGNSAIDGWRKAADFSGDSARTFSGPSLEEARHEVVAARAPINALPILRPGDAGRWDNGLEQVYRDRIIGGMSAFVDSAENRESFAEAVKCKLIQKISGRMTGGWRFIAARD
ncbi:hypothetical protein GCM10011415_42030 [Salipiger pallidus]|uniref:Uncharacterized protein n=1 Tax=Salipiger pallidus TaxID=1775170 RepID=A0A8J3EJP1_9RHOB|nr:hypothetical protein GCM10011415_42030 [Salipiger pallidus]